MIQSAPWSVKGVDPETRETARVLAQRSGMPLGEWLQTLISGQKEPYVPLFRDTEGENPSPLARIARQLEAAGQRYNSSGNPDRRKTDAATGVSAAVLVRHIRASEARMAGLVEKLIRRQEESEAHVAALVDALVDGFAGGQAATVPASPSARHETLPARGSVEDLEQRLAEIAAGLDAAPAQPQVVPPAADAVSEQIAALTREIAELRRTNTASAASRAEVADLRADIAALGQHLTGMPTPAHFAQIDRKLDLLARQAHDPTVLAAIQRETADIRARLGDLARQPEPAQWLEKKLDALQLTIEDGQEAISSTLSILSARLDALDSRGHDEAALTALEQQMGTMARSIEALGQIKPDLSGLEPGLQAALSASALRTLPEELQAHYRELRGLQEGQGRESRKALDTLQALLHQVASRLAAVEDLVRARTTGIPISGPPEAGEAPSLFGRERADDIVWSQELPRSLAGDAPLRLPVEDGAANGRPSQVSALGNGPEPARNTRSAFIAAARRAARAAAEAEGSLAEEAARPGASHEPFYKRHKRPILLGLAAVTMMMGALQGMRGPTAPANGRQLMRPAPEVAQPGKGSPQMRAGSAVSEAGPAALADRPPLNAAALRFGPPGEAVSLFDEARQLDTSRATTPDLAKAAGLYRQAAQLGYAPALFLLGLAYDKGRGVGRDAMLAGLWYQRAAEHGSLKAMYNLAVLYASGAVMGTPDYEQAARWFHQAAEQGHTASLYNFALLAAQGLGTPRDLATAYRFLAEAAVKGDPDALAKLNEVELRMTPEEKARARG